MRKHMVLFIILNILDYVSTRVALSLGGIEANPIARVFMSYNLLWLYKAVMVMAIIFLIHLLYRKRGEKRALFYYKLGNAILFFGYCMESNYHSGVSLVSWSHFS